MLQNNEVWSTGRMRDLGSRDSRFDSCHLDLSANDEINVAVPVRQKIIKDTDMEKCVYQGLKDAIKLGKHLRWGIAKRKGNGL